MTVADQVATTIHDGRLLADMMRHNLELEQRRALLLQAEQWQQSAEGYELVIADFLRTQAAIGNAKANIQDLLRILSTDTDEETQMLLTRAEQSAQVFYEQPGPNSQHGFESSTRALQKIDLNPQRLEELELQIRLLIENVL